MEGATRGEAEEGEADADGGRQSDVAVMESPKTGMRMRRELTARRQCSAALPPPLHLSAITPLRSSAVL